jgi:hypothetical protein
MSEDGSERFSLAALTTEVLDEQGYPASPEGRLTAAQEIARRIPPALRAEALIMALCEYVREKAGHPRSDTSPPPAPMPRRGQPGGDGTPPPGSPRVGEIRRWGRFLDSPQANLRTAPSPPAPAGTSTASPATPRPISSDIAPEGRQASHGQRTAENQGDGAVAARLDKEGAQP